MFFIQVLISGQFAILVWIFMRVYIAPVWTVMSTHYDRPSVERMDSFILQDFLHRVFPQNRQRVFAPRRPGKEGTTIFMDTPIQGE